MPYKVTPVGSASHPPVGTIIDDGSLELVEVLGVGGYGVVYRAEDTCSTSPKSYAVKCLVHSHLQSRQRQIHIREIALHQIASAHPNVVTLHRVVETFDYTYIIMDFAPDSDMFTQILHNCRYLGDNFIIKHVFMQLLDAVEYCHSLGIYHRDLKPENILCFDGGLRIAITDFGLATTDKVSEEFRTGSIYHMSPECQGGEFAPTGTYSPMFNDVWSLGIILLNLATGRNPWKSASINDPTFQAYMRDPLGFLPSVLPISLELNALLIRTLELDWRDRMTLLELREALEDITNFYSEGVIFEGSMARCPWEQGMEIESCSTTSKHEPPVQSHRAELKSRWSADSQSEIVFARRSLTPESSYGVPWDEYSSGTTWAMESQEEYDEDEDDEQDELYTVLRSRTPDSTRSLSPRTSAGPSTPNSLDADFGDRVQRQPPLTIDTNFEQARYYTGNVSMGSYFSDDDSAMQTAVEYEPYSSSFFLASPLSAVKPSVPPTLDATLVAEDKEMQSPANLWGEFSARSLLSRYSSLKSAVSEEISVVPRSLAPSPDLVLWPQLSTAPTSPSLTLGTSIIHSYPFPPPRPESPAKKLMESKAKTSSIFNHFHLFNKSSTGSSSSTKGRASPESEKSLPPQPFVSLDLSPRSASDCPSTRHNPSSSWMNVFLDGHKPEGVSVTRVATQRSRRRAAYLRSPRHWFLGGKLFASNHE